jgi:hypothetical protein
MPANHGLRPDDHEVVSPPRPESEEGYREPSISRCESRTRLILGVGSELLAQVQLDNSLLSTTAQQGRQTSDEN